MQKILLTFVMIMSFITSVAQVNIVNVNPQGNGQNQNEFFINGISSREDVGGIDIDQPLGSLAGNPAYCMVVFTNYNPFPVTVLYRYGNLYGGGTNWSKSGSIVLPPATNNQYPKKEVMFGSWYISKLDVATIARKLGN